MANNTSDDGKLQTTDTNMFVSILANSEKLKPKRELIHYEDIKNDADEKIETCIDDEPQNGETKDDVEHQQNNEEEQYDDVVKQEEHQPPQTVQTQPDNILGKQIKLTTLDDVDEYDTATPVRKRLLKLNMIRKLTELVRKGVKLSQNYNMDSDYKTMKYECELHESIRSKHNTVLLWKDGCLASINALEEANRKFDPFGLDLDGWSDCVGGKSDQLYDVFGEMYEKYSGSGRSLPPEMKFVGILGFSAARTHWVNASAKRTPSISDKTRDDPQYIEKIRQQALGNTISGKDTGKNGAFTEKLEKQYGAAMTQAIDYEYLRRQEEEYNKNKTQNVMRPPQLPLSLRNIQTNTSPQNGAKQYGLVGQQSFQNVHQPQEQHFQETQNVTPSSMTHEQFMQFRTANILEQRNKFEKELDQHKLTDKQSNGSSKDRKMKQIEPDEESQTSVVQINPDLDSIIKSAELKSNMSERLMPKQSETHSKPNKRKPRKQTKKSQNSVKLDL